MCILGFGIPQWSAKVFAKKFEPVSIKHGYEAMCEILAHASLSSERVAFVEEPVVGVGVRATLVQALVSGGMQVALHEYGFTVHIVSNTRWKKELGLGGHAKKEAIAGFIDTEHPLFTAGCRGDQDLYDATCLALYGAGVVRSGQRLARESGV